LVAQQTTIATQAQDLLARDQALLAQQAVITTHENTIRARQQALDDQQAALDARAAEIDRDQTLGAVNPALQPSVPPTTAAPAPDQGFFGLYQEALVDRDHTIATLRETIRNHELLPRTLNPSALAPPATRPEAPTSAFNLVTPTQVANNRLVIIDGLRQDIRNRDNTIVSRQAALVAFNAVVRDLRGTVDTLNLTNAQLQAALADRDLTITQLQDLLVARNRAITDLEQQIATFEDHQSQESSSERPPTGLPSAVSAAGSPTDQLGVGDQPSQPIVDPPSPTVHPMDGPLPASPHVSPTPAFGHTSPPPPDYHVAEALFQAPAPLIPPPTSVPADPADPPAYPQSDHSHHSSQDSI